MEVVVLWVSDHTSVNVPMVTTDWIVKQVSDRDRRAVPTVGSSQWSERSHINLFLYVQNQAAKLLLNVSSMQRENLTPLPTSLVSVIASFSRIHWRISTTNVSAVLSTVSTTHMYLSSIRLRIGTIKLYLWSTESPVEQSWQLRKLYESRVAARRSLACTVSKHV